ATTSYWALRAESRADHLQREAYRASIAAAQSSLDRGQAGAAREYLARAPEPLRGLEWRYLDQLVDRSDRTLDLSKPGESGQQTFTSAALSGEFAFMHNDDVSVLLNWKTGDRRTSTSKAAISTPYALSISPRGDRFVVCGEMTSALWNMHPLALIKQFDSEPRFESSAFTPDGSTLVMGLTIPRRIDFIEADTGATRHSMPVQGVQRAFPSLSPDGSRVLVESKDGVTAMFRLPECSAAWEFPGVQPRFSPDGRRVLLYSGLRQMVPRVHVLDADSGRENFSLPLEDNLVGAGGASSSIVGMSPDCSMLAHLTMSGEIRLISDSDLSTIGVLSGLGPRIGGIYNGVAFSDDGRWLAAHSRGHEIKVWNIQRSAVWMQASTKEELPSIAAAISPGASRSVTCNWGQIVAWDLKTGAPIWAAYPSFEFFSAIETSQRCDRIFVGGDRGTVLVLDADSGEVLRSAAPHGAMPFGANWTRSLAFGMDPPCLLAGFADGTVTHLDPITVEPRRQHSVGNAPVIALQPSPSGRRFACIVGGKPARVRVFAGESDLPELDLEIPGAASLAWTHDESLLAVGHTGGIQIVEPSGEPRIHIQGLRGTPTCLAFTADASRLVAGTNDGSLGIWFVHSGDLALDLPLPRREPALATAIRGDEQAIHVVTTGGATVAFETSKPDELTARAREAARNGRALYRRCKTIGGFLPETLELIGRAAGVHADARQEATRIARMLCEHPATLNNQAYSGTEHPPDEATLRLALRQNEAAIARCPDAFGLLTRGKVLHRAGRFAESLEALRRAAEQLAAIRPNWGEGPPELAALRGLCEAELGHVNEARKWFVTFDRIAESSRYKGSEEAARYGRMVAEARVKIGSR
ncbi:MAG: WD40 repeat domain-containing protein, partial [Pyrinomonadaceae bacterium]|nr:WD40 repeat domain-containing protein [Phycisphaerales bacterium]